MAKLHAARCPSCGANIQVPPNVPSITCRYCSNLITVQHQKPPPMAHMHGMPSTTLYIDPEEIAKAGRKIGCIIAAVIGLSVVLPLVIGLVAWGGGRMKSKVKPFPVECEFGETVELSGDWTGTGPVIAKAEHGCKIHIKQSKLKAPALLKSSISNVEITLENVTLDTTETAIQGSSGLKLHLVGSTITSGDVAVKAGPNADIDATASKIIGKKAALDLGPNVKLALKNASELTATEGVALKTTSSLVFELDGGKVDGSEGAVVATSGAKITGKNVIFNSKSGETFHLTSSTTLDLTDGAITSGGDSAIQSDGGDFTLAGTKVQGTSNAISAGNGLKLKASKKAALVATSGDGIEVTSNANIVLTDATIDGARQGIKSTLNMKLKPTQGARITGKSGGVVTSHNFELDANAATIDGGTGPGLQFESNGRIQMQQGALKGTPALKTSSKPITLALEGTKVEGEQQIAKR